MAGFRQTLVQPLRPHVPFTGTKTAGSTRTNISCSSESVESGTPFGRSSPQVICSSSERRERKSGNDNVDENEHTVSQNIYSFAALDSFSLCCSCYASAFP